MVRAGIEHKQFQKGDVVFFQGEPDAHLFKLETGALILYLMFQKPILINLVDEPRFFGFAPLCAGFHLYNAEAITKATVQMITYDSEESEAFQTYYPELLRDLVSFNQDRLTEKVETEETELFALILRLKTFSESLLVRFFPFAIVTASLKKWVNEGKIETEGKGSYRIVTGQ
jgi:CRP-like cAMP-binding protein